MKYVLHLLLLAIAWLCLLAACSRPRPVTIVEKASPPEPYRGPLLSPGAQFSALPPGVQHTIRAETGSAEIASIRRETNDSGDLAFEIRFENYEVYPPLLVDPEGNLLGTNWLSATGASLDRSMVGQGRAASSGLSLSEVPAPVVQALQSRAPGAEIASIHQETWGDRILYIVTFIDEAHYPKMYITSDGTVESH